MTDDWFPIKIIFPITTKVNTDDEDDSELSETDRLTYDLQFGYEMGMGYWDLLLDPIFQINPRCVIKKGTDNKDKENTRKKYYTEVVFQSGNYGYAACKPEELKSLVNKFMEGLSEKGKD